MPHESPSRTAVRHDGFTLIELLITIAVIVILSSIAVPNFQSGRMQSNETAAIATLRAIASAQAKFQVSATIDRDSDGMAEFGTLGEMSGSTPVVGTGELLAPTYLPRSLGLLDANGRVSKNGYLYAIYLPDAAGLGVPETAARRADADPNLAEMAYSVVAWPARVGATGNFTYYLNGSGDIVKTREGRYSGDANVPAPGCALVGAPSVDHVVGGRLATDAVGADGHRWFTVQ